MGDLLKLNASLSKKPQGLQMVITIGRGAPGWLRIDEESHLPDEEGHKTFAKDAMGDGRLGYIKQVYNILSVQLLLTVGVAGPFQRMDAAKWHESTLLSFLIWLTVILTVFAVCSGTCCRGLANTY